MLQKRPSIARHTTYNLIFRGMTIELTCAECDYRESGSSDRDLMNKIIMWNHVQKVHPHVAERIMRIYNRVPDDIYDVRPLGRLAF